MNNILVIFLLLILISSTYSQSDNNFLSVDSIDFYSLECESKGFLEFANRKFEVCSHYRDEYTVHKRDFNDTTCCPSYNVFLLDDFLVEIDSCLIYFEERSNINGELKFHRIHRFDNKNQIDYRLHIRNGVISAFSLFEFLEDTIVEKFCFLNYSTVSGVRRKYVKDLNLMEMKNKDYLDEFFQLEMSRHYNYTYEKKYRRDEFFYNHILWHW